MLISRENYALLHILQGHEGHAYNEYMLISGMLITRVDCIHLLETPVVDLNWGRAEGEFMD